MKNKRPEQPPQKAAVMHRNATNKLYSITVDNLSYGERHMLIMNKVKYSEKEVKAAVYAYLNAKNLLYIPIQNQGQYDPRKRQYHRFKGTRGAPDLMVHVGAGVWYCIELKSSTGKQSDYQKEFERKVDEGGGYYYVVRNINDLIQIGL